MNLAMIKKNLTPVEMRCDVFGCPAVFELEDGRLAIVGKRPEGDLGKELAPVVGLDEYAIVISPQLLANVLPSSRR
jgi:hypothetical protein